MKRFVMMIALLLVTIALVCGIAVAEEAKGIYDGVSWQVTDDHVLILGDGTEQTFDAREERYADEYPWYQYGETIEKIRFDGIVHGSGSMSALFAEMPELTDVDVSGFETEFVWDMSVMFNGDSQLLSLDLSGLKTDNVTDLSHMFTNCMSLTGVEIVGWNTSSLQTTWGMFGGCVNLISVDLSGWSCRSLTNISDMFRNCRSLISIYVDDQWTLQTDGSLVSDMMFSNCSALTGGNGTMFDEQHTNSEYARVDAQGVPGYFRIKRTEVRDEGFLQSPDKWVRAGYKETTGVSGGVDTWHYFENKAGDHLGYLTYGAGQSNNSPYYGRWYDYGDGVLHGTVNGVSFTVESYDELKRLDQEWLSQRN